MTSNQNNNSLATILHISQLIKYIIPFGGIIFPLIIWSAKKNQGTLVDDTGKSVLNFNISMFIYSVVFLFLYIFGVLYFVFDFAIEVDRTGEEFIPIAMLTYIFIGIGIIIMFYVFEFILALVGAIKASNGEVYQYPLSIKFLK